jgi:hypothetical protein
MKKISSLSKIYKNSLIKIGDILINEYGFTEKVDFHIFNLVKLSTKKMINKRWVWINCGWFKISDLEKKEYKKIIYEI